MIPQKTVVVHEEWPLVQTEKMLVSDMLNVELFFSIVCLHHQKAMEEEEEEEEETEAKPDPLHQLILHFSRTALTEKA